MNKSFQLLVVQFLGENKGPNIMLQIKVATSFQQKTSAPPDHYIWINAWFKQTSRTDHSVFSTIHTKDSQATSFYALKVWAVGGAYWTWWPPGRLVSPRYIYQLLWQHFIFSTILTPVDILINYCLLRTLVHSSRVLRLRTGTIYHASGV